MWILILAIVVVIAIIMAVAGSKKDEKIALSLKGNLAVSGFITSGEIEVFDKDNQGKPFRFFVDRQNKKWALANYRATTANTYNFTDLVDYTVTYRTMGNDVVKGDEYVLTASDYQDNKCSLIEMCGINSNNCEYIDIRVIYTGEAQKNNICSYFILFEKQQTFLNAQNNDFHVPSVCITNAKAFEGMLHEIVKENRK